jgi:hypothetical protein
MELRISIADDARVGLRRSLEIALRGQFFGALEDRPRLLRVERTGHLLGSLVALPRGRFGADGRVGDSVRPGVLVRAAEALHLGHE